jgi:hypothetical protein
MLAFGLAACVEIGEDEDLGVTLMPVLIQHMALDLSPTPRERDVLIVAEVLRAEHEQVMTQKRVVESREASVIERLRQIHAEHFGTQYRVDRTYSEPGWQAT